MIRSRWTAVRWPLLIAAVVIAVDQMTKHWALNALSPTPAHPDGRELHVLWTVQFNLAFNSGVAFSSGRGLGPFVPVIAVFVVIGLLAAVGKSSSRWFTVAVGLMIGGALGNIVDRVLRGEGGLHGAVVDFIDLQWWPIFNIADIGVVVGGCLVVVTSLLARDSAEDGDADTPETGPQ